MTQILHIDASAHFETSRSRAASAKIVADLGGSVTDRDLAANPLPFVDAAWANARLVDPAERTAEQTQHLSLSDQLIGELQTADILVIGTPIYNFAAPATLKAWMDLVARPGVTFKYTPDGPVGLLTGKKAILTVASGGVPIGSQMDHLTPHLKLFLGFVGITDIDVRAASDVVGPDAS